jgi:alkylhydroperoxidase family enzyme
LAKQTGITEEQLHALPFSQWSPVFDAQEQAVVAYADSVTRGASAVREETRQELRQYFSEDQIVELTLVICMGNFTNRFNEALEITPDLG